MRLDFSYLSLEFFGIVRDFLMSYLTTFEAPFPLSLHAPLQSDSFFSKRWSIEDLKKPAPEV